jgi:hypothetical protein
VFGRCGKLVDVLIGIQIQGKMFLRLVPLIGRALGYVLLFGRLTNVAELIVGTKETGCAT